MAKQVTVGSHECISCVAFENGFYWETLWNLPENSQLKNERKDPNILKVGDVIHVPNVRLKELSKATGQTHNFVMKGTTRLRLRVLEEPKPKDPPPAQPPAPPPPGGPPKHLEAEDPEVEAQKNEDVPRANVPYKLKIGRFKIKEGTTDGDGMLDEVIPANARDAELTIDPGQENEAVYKIKLGRLQPLSEISGVKIRLRNLGFDCGNTNDDDTPSFGAALKAFQEKNGLEASGRLNDETRSKLKEIHKS